MDNDLHPSDSRTVPETSKEKFPWLIVSTLILVAIASITATIFILKGYRLPFLKRSIPVTSDITNVTPTQATLNTDGWSSYTDTQAGFTFFYPPTVVLEGEKTEMKSSLSVSVEKIDDIPESLPMKMGRDDAIALQQSLLTSPEGTVKIGTLSGQVETTFSQFEICSVFFSRKLTFFPGAYRVMILVSGPVEAIEEAMPEFFTVDEKNCGQQRMWNREMPEDFLSTVSQGKGKGIAQEWYDAFDGIVKTVAIATPITSPISSSDSQACDVSDNALCNIITDVKTAVSTKSIDNILAYQILSSVTCDPDGMFTTVCDGASKGTVRQGYTIGYNQSEGSIVNREQYKNTLTTYLESQGPFRYKGSLLIGDKAAIVFLNPQQDKILVLPMKRTEITWRMDYVLVGNDFTGTFSAMKPQILDTVR